MGDFNMEPKDSPLTEFLQINNLTNLTKGNTCFKGKGSCNDSILANRKYSFESTCSYKAGISDHHHMIYTVLKSGFHNTEPKLLNYRDFFHKRILRRNLEKLYDCGNSHDYFNRIFTTKLNKHAPKKESKLGKTITAILIKPYA